MKTMSKKNDYCHYMNYNTVQTALFHLGCAYQESGVFKEDKGGIDSYSKFVSTMAEIGKWKIDQSEARLYVNSGIDFTRPTKELKTENVCPYSK